VSTSLLARLNAPIDSASLAAFRVMLGILLAAAMVRFLALGWIDELYLRPQFHFTWDAFAWVRPLPSGLMYALYGWLAALALGIAAGFRSRLCASLFLAGFTYIQLIDKTTYLNHDYLVSLLVGLVALLPVHDAWSVEARTRPVRRAPRAPAWALWLLRFQIAVVFVFAGLATINSDWLVEAQPLRIWLAARSDLPILGPLLATPASAYLFSWGGALYDLSIAGLLLWSRTRRFAYGTVLIFHGLTWVLCPIGMFPWIMMVATTLFFPPDWPRRWIPVAPLSPSGWATPRLGAAGVLTVAAYAVVQVAVPLRGYCPGCRPEWTNDGFNFAWRVMIVEKAGAVDFRARDPRSGAEWPVRALDYVTERQARMMAQDPDMIRALARRIAEDWRSRGRGAVEVRADAFVSLNGRPMQRIVDPTVDLAAPDVEGWIVPLADASEPPDHVP